MEIDLNTGAAVLTVTSKKYGTFRVLVDAEDFERVSRHTWAVQMRKRRVYFVTNVRKSDGTWTKLRLHRLVMDAPDGLQVDHVHHNYLDMRKSQLRLVTNQENQQNMRSQINSSSKFKGVCWHKRDSKWQAQIHVDGKTQFLGRFNTEEAAANAYNDAASDLNAQGAIYLLNRLSFDQEVAA